MAEEKQIYPREVWIEGCGTKTETLFFTEISVEGMAPTQAQGPPVLTKAGGRNEAGPRLEGSWKQMDELGGAIADQYVPGRKTMVPGQLLSQTTTMGIWVVGQGGQLLMDHLFQAGGKSQGINTGAKVYEIFQA